MGFSMRHSITKSGLGFSIKHSNTKKIQNRRRDETFHIHIGIQKNPINFKSYKQSRNGMGFSKRHSNTKTITE